MSRGWGNTPPDLKGTLGTLLRTTLIQLGSLRDAAVRELGERGRDLGAQAGQALRNTPMMQARANWPNHGPFPPESDWQITGARPGLAARRGDVLATIGEIIYELARAKELDLDEFPELRDAICELEQIDSDLDERGRPLAGAGFALDFLDPGLDPGLAPTLDPNRVSHLAVHESGVTSTFDVLAGRESPRTAIWRPDPSDYNLDGSLIRDELNTTSNNSDLARSDAISAMPSTQKQTQKQTQTQQTRPSRRTGPGHITFVSDEVEEDLSEYMHDDDVPEHNDS